MVLVAADILGEESQKNRRVVLWGLRSCFSLPLLSHHHPIHVMPHARPKRCVLKVVPFLTCVKLLFFPAACCVLCCCVCCFVLFVACCYVPPRCCMLICASCCCFPCCLTLLTVACCCCFCYCCFLLLLPLPLLYCRYCLLPLLPLLPLLLLLFKGVREQPRPAVPNQAGRLPLPAGGLDGLRGGRCTNGNAHDGVL